MEPVDPLSVPTRTLRSGATMPAIGVGTFGSDHVDHATVARSVGTALELGYRHIDCASVYRNEPEIGDVLRKTIAGGWLRDELWISSKVWNDQHDDVAAACEQTLTDLGLEYLDNYLVHWPFPNFHPPHCDVDERNPNAVAFDIESFLATWRQMEALVERGLVRHIGTSNMTIAKLDLLLPEASVLPSVNQMELHPHLQQPELFGYLVEHDIEPIGFCPIGSPARPARDRTDDDSSTTDDPLIREIARHHGVHPATLCVKWGAQRGQTPIPFSTNPRNLAANLRAVTTNPLSDDEMRAIASADRNCRLIKGHVFLWKDDQPWEDLWDKDGTIAQ
jgi:alcohol dehydrogenase (NADP+)